MEIARLRVRKKKKGNPKVVGVIFILAAIGLSAMWPWYMHKQFRLQGEGILVVGTIVEDKDDPSEPKLSCLSGGRRSPQTCTHYAKYEYEGESYNVRVENMTTRDFDFEAGDSVNLVLDPVDYAVAVHESDADDALLNVAFFTIAIFVVWSLGVLVLYKAFKRD